MTATETTTFDELNPPGSLHFIQIDWENNADEWWTAARTDVDIPDNVDTAWQQVIHNQGATVTTDDRDAFIEWASSLPGWDEGPEYAPHPLTIGEVDA